MLDTPPCLTPGAEGIFVGAALDTETTGLSPETDQVIEIGIHLFRFELPSGRVVEPLESFSALQDPGVPLSPRIVEVTGITQEMLIGHKIEWSQVDALLSRANLLLAHNAPFDRGFVDRKSQVSRDKVWACTSWQIEWRAKGFKNSRLQDLCASLGIVYQAHRAMSDVEAMMQLIARTDAFTGKPYLHELIAAAGQESAYLWAEGRTYDQRDLLKAHGFRWNPKDKTWGKIIPAAEVTLQIENTRTLVPDAKVLTRPVALKDRHKSAVSS